MTIGKFELRDIPEPVLGVDFSDQSHLTRADTTLETIPVTISAYFYTKIQDQ